MKIKLDYIIDHPVHVEIQGNEDWLEPIYAGFDVPEGAEKPLITGTFKVMREIEDLFKVSGHLAYIPWVDCSRCGEPIHWDVSSQFNYRAIPVSMDETVDGSGERTFVHSDDEVLAYREHLLDLAEVVNDQINLAIPLQTTHPEGSDQCILANGLAPDQVFQDPKDSGETHRPFDVLKNLKF